MNSVEVLRGSLGLRYLRGIDLSFDLDLNRDVVAHGRPRRRPQSESFAEAPLADAVESALGLCICRSVEPGTP